MDRNLGNVDKNSLKSIYTEDIYIIKEHSSSKVDQTPISSAKLFGVILNNKEELNNYNDFLTKVFQSIHVDLKNVDFLFGEAPLKKETYKTLFSFGIPSAGIQLNLNEKKYELLEHENCKFLFSDPISDVEKNLEKKKLLWAALKKLI